VCLIDQTHKSLAFSRVAGTAIAQLPIDLYQNEPCDEDLLLQIVLA
jgi:hypothetical protein